MKKLERDKGGAKVYYEKEVGKIMGKFDDFPKRLSLEQQGQFVCMRDSVNGRYNPQNVWNMDPEDIHYEIADWALAGNTLNAVGESLFFFNPYSEECPTYFPPGGIGVLFNRVNNHCFYTPTQKYATT